MSPWIEEETAPAGRDEIVAENIDQDVPGRRGSVEGWLQNHLDATALAVLAAGFALRAYVAGKAYLNPDEAWHYLLMHQSSLWLAYKASLTNAHPPLIFAILYYWQLLGQSEWMLRLPSVLAGTAFCWVLYKWTVALFGRAAGLSALIVAAFSPAMIALSVQVRGYAVLLICLGSALFFLERALVLDSSREMGYYTVALYLAILTHYSAVFFTLAAGFYVLARIVASRPAWKVVAAWTAGQLGALAIYAFLYVTHISKIRKSEMDMWAGPHEEQFFHPGQASRPVFILKQTLALFQYIFWGNTLYKGLFLLFLLAVTLLLGRDLFLRGVGPRTWPVGLLFLLPFAAVSVAAIAGIYPYSGTRHNVFLAPFMIAGVSLVLAKLFRQRLWAVSLVAILIATEGHVSGKMLEPYLTDGLQKRALMTDAVSYIRQSVPRGNPILVDMQSGILLSYYLCDPADTLPIEPFESDFVEFSCNGYSVISANDRTWKLTPANFVSQFVEMATTYRLRPGDRVWVFQAGWGANLDSELSWFVMKYRCLTAKSFGPHIAVIPFDVGADFSPELPPGSPHLSPLHRCVNEPLPKLAAQAKD